MMRILDTDGPEISDFRGSVESGVDITSIRLPTSRGNLPVTDGIRPASHRVGRAIAEQTLNLPEAVDARRTGCE